MNIPLQTSQDILFISLSAAILLITFFVCWSLFYLAMSLRDSRAVLKDVRKRIEKFWSVVDLLHEKLQVGGAVFSLAARGIKELAESLKEANGKKVNKKSK